MNTLRLALLAVTSLALPAATALLRAEPSPELNQKVQHIFEDKCAGCHFGKGNVNAQGRKGRNPILNAKTTRADLLAIQSDEPLINESDPKKSTVYALVAKPADDEDRMPKTKKKPGEPGYLEPLSADEIALILEWVSAK